MPGHDEQIAVVREWMAKAENDLRNDEHTLKLGKECPTDTVCFHAQQCVEKHLEALLVLHGIRFPKIHGIGELRLLPQDIRPAINPEEQERLTDFATVTRYPGMYDPILLKEAKETVNLARRVRRDVRRYLPK